MKITVLSSFLAGMLLNRITLASSGRVTTDFRRAGRAMKWMRTLKTDSKIDSKTSGGPKSNSLRGGGGGDGPEDRASTSSQRVPAILFDIDGVFKHGGAWEPKGLSALRRVQRAGIPYAFMTNGGGGRTEAEYASEMSAKLLEAHVNTVQKARKATAGGETVQGEEVESSEDESGLGEEVDDPSLAINPEHMVLSYSPWRRDVAPEFGDKPVLVVGDPMEKVMAVARDEGFARAVHISEYDQKHPLLNPFKSDNTLVPGGAEAEAWDEDFHAVLVFTDPLNTFEALQLVVDVLLSSKPGLVEVEPGHEIPVYFSNPDVLWKTQFPYPRFGQGAFKLALEAVFVARLQSLGFSPSAVRARLGLWRQYGKPEVPQFDYALNVALRPQVESCGGRPITDVYVIGDNPTSDMQGPKNMNALGESSLDPQRNGGGSSERPIRWSGALVRTGVYREGIDDPNGAIVVCDDVAEAVDAVLSRHGL